MQRENSYAIAILLVSSAIGAAAPPIQVELATERGVQITAPHEWLQLLTSLGINNVRIRGAQPADQPRVDKQGTAERPSYRVLGLVTLRNELKLPGGTFSRGDRARLKDYFDRLGADGAESLTASRGMFGLTEKEIAAVFADLTQPINFPTKGQAPGAVVDRLQENFMCKVAVDGDADRVLQDATPITDELEGITAGTGAAMLLRSRGLVLRPEKTRGQPVVLRIAAVDAVERSISPAGKSADKLMRSWPIGWEPEQSPGKTAPSLFEYLNAEIDGYTLEETLAAVAPRLKIPMYLDHAILAANQIEPAKIRVKLARSRTIYKLIIDRVLSQARLGSQVRVDEAGTPFLWVTR